MFRRWTLPVPGVTWGMGRSSRSIGPVIDTDPRLGTDGLCSDFNAIRCGGPCLRVGLHDCLAVNIDIEESKPSRGRSEWQISIATVTIRCCREFWNWR